MWRSCIHVGVQHTHTAGFPSSALLLHHAASSDFLASETDSSTWFGDVIIRGPATLWLGSDPDGTLAGTYIAQNTLKEWQAHTTYQLIHL